MRLPRTETEMKFTADTGRAIEVGRKIVGISRRELGQRIGTTTTQVSRWEDGVTLPRLDTIVQIAEVLNVEVTELIPDGPPLPGPTDLAK